MEKLPQELIDRISGHLDTDELKQTLTINQKFQAAAERYSGAFDEFGLDEDNADQFLDRFSNHRSRYLRRVKFATVLPAPEEDHDDEKDDTSGFPPCRESKEDLKALDVEFTRQINSLFSTMKKLEQRVRDYGPGNVQLTIYAPTTDVDPGSFCYHRAFVSWKVHLLSPENLPVLSSIRSLRFENGAPFNPFQ